MSVELLETLSILCYVVSGLLVLLSIALFFLLDVPRLYGELSGRAARRAIEDIRQKNQSGVQKAVHTGSAKSGKKSHFARPKKESINTAELSAEMQAPSWAPGPEPEGATSVLSDCQEQSEGNTTVLSANPAGETTVLTAEQSSPTPTPAPAYQEVHRPVEHAGAFSLDLELFFTESSEIIQ